MKFRKFWEAHFILLELLLALILCMILILWAELFGGKSFIESCLLNVRKELYAAIAAVFGSLLGYSITAVSIVIGYAANEKFLLIKNSKHYMDLWTIFTSSMKVFAATTLFALIGLLIDRDNSPHVFIFYIIFFLVILSLFRISRCIWVLDKIIKIVAK
jgi:hypothetical protein